MFEALIVIAFLWLSVKFIGLILRVTWGLAKVVAFALFLLALPALILGILFAGGLILILPIVLVLSAIAIVSSCV